MHLDVHLAFSTSCEFTNAYRIDVFYLEPLTVHYCASLGMGRPRTSLVLGRVQPRCTNAVVGKQMGSGLEDGDLSRSHTWCALHQSRSSRAGA